MLSSLSSLRYNGAVGRNADYVDTASGYNSTSCLKPGCGKDLENQIDQFRYQEKIDKGFETYLKAQKRKPRVN